MAGAGLTATCTVNLLLDRGADPGVNTLPTGGAVGVAGTPGRDGIGRRRCGEGSDLVRPDGYVALALEGPREVGELTALARRWGLRLGTPAQ